MRVGQVGFEEKMGECGEWGILELLRGMRIARIVSYLRRGNEKFVRSGFIFK